MTTITETQVRPLAQLRKLGQRPWCDALSRQMLRSGELARLVSDMDIVGLTSNPSIFQKALASGDAYDEQVSALARRDLDATAIYEALAVDDIRAVADLLRPVYDRSNAQDGYVSLEVSPELANDSDGTVIEARRLHAAVDRPNLMIKVPGTAAGLPAITTLLGEGINVNVTLVFGLVRYREVLAAHAQGLGQARSRGLGLGTIASVASFFVSRVDTLIDARLEELARVAFDDRGESAAKSLLGKAAIANARGAYGIWQEWLEQEPMKSLAAAGAQPQKLLWASTSTKNPAYRDVLYVEELIGPDTVNTMPLETIAAFDDHGVVRGSTIAEGREEATQTLRGLAEAGIDMEAVAVELEEAGVKLFADAFVQLRDQLAVKIESLKAVK